MCCWVLLLIYALIVDQKGEEIGAVQQVFNRFYVSVAIWALSSWVNSHAV